MRLFMHTLLCTVLFAPIGMAQEQAQTPESEIVVIDNLPIRALDLTNAVIPAVQAAPSVVVDLTPVPRKRHQWEDWYAVPRLTVSRYNSSGFFVSRHWYRVQDQHMDIKTQTLTGDLRNNRFFASGQLTTVPDRSAIASRSLAFRLVPVRLWHIRPGFGYWYADSKDSQELFTSGDTAITTGTERRTGAFVMDLGVGGYDRSYARVVGMYGNVRVVTHLDLEVDGQNVQSPLAVRNADNSDFVAVGGEAALRRWGFSLEGSLIGFKPRWTSLALSHDCAIASVTASYMTPFKYVHLGAFARTTRISKVPVGTRSSLQFLDDGWTFGLSVRVP